MTREDIVKIVNDNIVKYGSAKKFALEIADDMDFASKRKHGVGPIAASLTAIQMRHYANNESEEDTKDRIIKNMMISYGVKMSAEKTYLIWDHLWYSNEKQEYQTGAYPEEIFNFTHYAVPRNEANYLLRLDERVKLAEKAAEILKEHGGDIVYQIEDGYDAKRFNEVRDLLDEFLKK